MNITMFWDVIINPNTLNIGKEKLWKQLEDTLIFNNFLFSEHLAFTQYDCEQIVLKLLEKGKNNFIIVGGDGTLNEVVNAVFKHCNNPEKVSLALIPSGTGNDWSRTHNIKPNIKLLTEMFLKNKIIQHDVGKVIVQNNEKITERYFINIAGLGFDAEVIIRINKSKRLKYAGKFIYLKNLFLCLLKNKPNRCRFEINGESFTKKVFSIAVGIGKYNGGGMMQVPMANPLDGKMDLVIIEPLNFLEVIAQLPKLYKGQHISYKKVHHFVSNHICIIPENRMFAEVEGEIVGDGSFEILTVEKKIGVLVP